MKPGFAVPLRYKVHTPRTSTVGASRNLYVAHGLLGNSMNWATPSKHLCEHPLLRDKIHKLFALDLRNHGDSPHTSTHTCSDIASDMESFVLEQQRKLAQELTGVNEAELNTGSIAIGHSMGGLALMGLLLRRYNEEALFTHHDNVFGEWKENRRKCCVESMKNVNESNNYPETLPIRDVLFSDPTAGKLPSDVSIESRIPKWGRLHAAVIVDVTPVVQLGEQRSDAEADSVYGTLYRMKQVDLSRIHGYDDVKDELMRVGMKSAGMRDFVTTNIVFQGGADDQPRVAQWKCNLEVLYKDYGAFKPSIVHWYNSASDSTLTPTPCTLPVLFVFGEKSPYNDSANRRKIADFFPNSQQVVIKGAGHFVHYEKTKEFVEAVAPFIAQHF